MQENMTDNPARIQRDAPLRRRVAIVIVNYRTAALTIDCLRSLADTLPDRDRPHTVVVDNLSGDDSVVQLESAVRRHAWGDWVHLIAMERNGGFAYGNNAGIRHLVSEHPSLNYVLLLNPDTVVRDGAVEKLVEFMDANDTVGIAGSRLEDPDTTPQRSAFRFPTFLSEFEQGMRLGLVSRLLDRWVVAPAVSETPCLTDWVAGASMIVRREVFETLGVLDDGYFMYYEEVDFCLRAKRAGWPCWYVPDSRVVHLVGQASGVTDTRRAAKRRPAYWFESRKRYFVRNHGRLYAILADAAWLIGYGLWRLRRMIQRRPDVDPPKMLVDSLRHSVFVGGFAT